MLLGHVGSLTSRSAGIYCLARRQRQRAERGPKAVDRYSGSIGANGTGGGGGVVWDQIGGCM